MLIGNDILASFQAASGISADKLSLYIRTVLLAIVFIWAALCVKWRLHYIQHHGLEIESTLQTFVRVLFIVALTIVLVFIA